MAEEAKAEGETPSWKLAGPLSLASFELGVTLGTGSFGRVRFGTHKATGTHWAIKMLKKAEVVRLQQVEHMISEKNILNKMDHPFIVRLAGTFQDPRYLYLALEYIVGGEFFTHLRKAGRLDNNAARFYAAQITLIFEYLHSQDFIYRDLKPENLLLDAQGFIKITDFGFAKRVAFKTYTLCGTPEYIAPEVLLNKGHGKGVDWWTLGILVFEMLAGQPPFVDDDPMGIYQQILAGKINFPRFFDRQAKSIIKKLLTADLTKRYGCLKGGANDIKKHKWYSGMDFNKLLSRQLQPPIVPRVKDETDTSNFDPYPDSLDEAEIPTYTSKDPFEDF
jgi:serine/threonine protein kinase